MKCRFVLKNLRFYIEQPRLDILERVMQLSHFLFNKVFSSFLVREIGWIEDIYFETINKLVDKFYNKFNLLLNFVRSISD